mgnify:CR=1 FL=1
MDLRGQSLRLDPVAMLRRLRGAPLPLRFSAGIWCFSPAASRFHEPYQPARSIEERLALAAELKPDGLAALEAHVPDEISRENLDLWRRFSAETGIRVLTVIPQLFRDAEFEFGSLSSPIEPARRRAIERTIEALELNRDLDTDFMVLWPGIDGVELSYGADIVGQRERFAEGLAEAMEAVPGVRVAFEPKPYEPRGRILFGTTAEGMLLAPMVESRLRHPRNRALLDRGDALLCLNPEIGHVLMGYEDLAMAIAWPLGQGRLAHLHVNSQPLGNYDQDLSVGLISPEQLDGLLLLLRLHGYDGSMGIDINPERLPVETAIRLSMDALRFANERIDAIDHARLIDAWTSPAQHRGTVERILLESYRRAPR